MTTNGKTLPVLARAFSRSRAKRSSSPATSPPRTTCFDIFSPPPGDSDVISHVDRLSSNETKIAPRSVRIAVGASGRSATVCMVASRVGGSNLTLPEYRSLSTSPMGSNLRLLGEGRVGLWPNSCPRRCERGLDQLHVERPPEVRLRRFR